MRLITDAPVPSPGRGEVLIRVTAAGVNFADISKAHGTFRDGPQPPYLAGFEAAGEVVAVGEAVTGPAAGDPRRRRRRRGVRRVHGAARGRGDAGAGRLDRRAGAGPGRELADRAGRAQAPGRHRRRADRADPRRGGRDRSGRGDAGQALRRDGHRHRVAEQARDGAGARAPTTSWTRAAATSPPRCCG